MKNVTVTTILTTQKRLENYDWITTGDTVLEGWSIDKVKSYVSEENLKQYSIEHKMKAIYEYTPFGFLPTRLTSTHKRNETLRIITSFRYKEI